jgi:hypothetical protein
MLLFSVPLSPQAGFVAKIEKRLGRTLALGKRGRKPRNQAVPADQ